MKTKFIIYSVLIFINFLFADTIKMSNLENTNILNKVNIFIDKNSKMRFEDIKKNSNLFKKSDKNNIHLGYSLDTVWIKFSIINDLNENINKKLVIDNTMLDEVTLYEKINSSHFKEYKNGVLYRKEFNATMRYNFEIKLQTNQIKEYYLKVKSETSGLYFHLNILDTKEYLKKDITYQLILTLFFGSMITLIIYNFFIFLFTKEIVYLYYIGYIFFLLINHISFTSMNLYFLPLEFEHIDAYLTIYYLQFTCLFMILFTVEFLEIKKYKYINYFLNSLLLIIVFSILISLLSERYILDLVTYFLLVLMVLLIIVSLILSIKNKNKNAKYFAIAWGINGLGYIMLGLKQMGGWSLLDYFPFTYELCCFIEGIMFSIILSKKLSKTKELETSLKTNKVLLKELHHRIKNNMQFIMIMYKMKLEKFINDDIEKKLDEIETTIQAISKTHEILYSQNDLEEIDTKIYFDELINKIKNSYNTEHITFSKSIENSLNVQTSIYLGIILNELIINSLKYAFLENKGNINILIKKEDLKTIFLYEDNGIGFNYEDKKDESFGLTFIESIVKDELKGKISFENRNSTKVTIILNSTHI